MALTAEQKQALITTLTTHKYSGFTKDDEALLNNASDERLEAFRVQAESRAQTEENLKAAAQRKLTTEELEAVMPDDLKALLSRQRESENREKLELVTALKTAQSEYNEAELSAMSIDELRRVSRLARIVDNEPVQYFGRTRVASAFSEEKKTNVYLNPPDPYAEALKALK